MNYLFYLDTFSYHVVMNFLFVIIIILIPFAVITRVFRRKSWKREIPTYMFCQWETSFILVLISCILGIIIKPVWQQIFVFAGLIFLTFFAVWAGKRHCVNWCGRGNFYVLGEKSGDQLSREEKVLSAEEIAKNRIIGLEQIKYWKPIWVFFIPAFVPLVLMEIVLFLVR